MFDGAAISHVLLSRPRYIYPASLNTFVRTLQTLNMGVANEVYIVLCSLFLVQPNTFFFFFFSRPRAPLPKKKKMESDQKHETDEEYLIELKHKYIYIYIYIYI